MVCNREILWVQIWLFDNHFLIHRFVGEVMMNYNLVIESSIQPWALKLIIFLQVKEFTLEVHSNVVCTVWATVKLHKDFITQEWLDPLQWIVLSPSDSSRSTRSIWGVVWVISFLAFSGEAYAICSQSLVSLKTLFYLVLIINAQAFISMSMERHSLKFTIWGVVEALIFVPEFVRKDIIHWSMHV